MAGQAPASGRAKSLFSSICCNIAKKDQQPNTGQIQVLDLPVNLVQLDWAVLSGVQVPIYDGRHFMNAFFKGNAKDALQKYCLDSEACQLPGHHDRTGLATQFTKSPEFCTHCSEDMEEDHLIFCIIKKWRLITRLDSVMSHAVNFILVITEAEFPSMIKWDIMASRLWNHKFPVFTSRTPAFYDSRQFLVNFLDHGVSLNNERNLHNDSFIKSISFKLLNAWRKAGVAVQLTSLDASGTHRVRPFIWCQTAYLEMKPWDSEKALITQMAQFILKKAKEMGVSSEVGDIGSDLLTEQTEDPNERGSHVKVSLHQSDKHPENQRIHLPSTEAVDDVNAIPSTSLHKGIEKTKETQHESNSLDNDQASLYLTPEEVPLVDIGKRKRKCPKETPSISTASLSNPKVAHSSPPKADSISPITSVVTTSVETVITTSPIMHCSASVPSASNENISYDEGSKDSIAQGTTLSLKVTQNPANVTNPPVTSEPEGPFPLSQLSPPKSPRRTRSKSAKLNMDDGKETYTEISSVPRTSLNPSTTRFTPLFPIDGFESKEANLSFKVDKANEDVPQNQGDDSSMKSTVSTPIKTTSPIQTPSSTPMQTPQSTPMKTAPITPTKSSLSEDKSLTTLNKSDTQNLPSPDFLSRTSHERQAMDLTLDEDPLGLATEGLQQSMPTEQHQDRTQKGLGSIALLKTKESQPLSTSESTPNSSFFTADSSPISQGGLSAYLSEVETSSSSPLLPFTLNRPDVSAPKTKSEATSEGNLNCSDVAVRQLDELSSEDFMSRIASETGAPSTAPSAYRSPPKAIPSSCSSSPSSSTSEIRLDDEAMRIQRLSSQSSVPTDPEAERLHALFVTSGGGFGHSSPPTGSQTTSAADQSEAKRLSKLASLNASFNLGDSNGDDENFGDDRFETISQMDFAGVTSFYAIKSKGSPKRSPRRSSPGSLASMRSSSPEETLEDEEEDRRRILSGGKILKDITPRRPLREPLERSANSSTVGTEGSPPFGSISLSSIHPQTSQGFLSPMKTTPVTRKQMTRRHLLPSQVELSQALRYLQGKTQNSALAEEKNEGNDSFEDRDTGDGDGEESLVRNYPEMTEITFGDSDEMTKGSEDTTDGDLPSMAEEGVSQVRGVSEVTALEDEELLVIEEVVEEEIVDTTDGSCY